MRGERKARLLAMVARDEQSLGKRLSWREYAEELLGDPGAADCVRQIYKRAIHEHPALTACRHRVPTVAQGANPAAQAGAPKIDEFVEHAITGVDLHQRTTKLIRSTEVFIKTSTPIAIANMADFHLGSAGCDHQRWAEDYEYLMSAVGLYTVLNGDLTENCVGFPDTRGMVTQVLSPEEQDELMFQALEALHQRKKVLAVTAGNHDHGRDSRLVGRSFISKSCHRLDIPFFHGFGIIDVLVGATRAKAQRYTITASHTGLGSSMYNKVHGANRLWQKTRTDIVFTAHLHQPCVSLDVEHGKKRLLAQAGTHNTSAEYALYRYKGGGWTAWPTVVLFPDVHDFAGFLCPRMAMKVVNASV